jgi:hypothetical protein
MFSLLNAVLIRVKFYNTGRHLYFRCAKLNRTQHTIQKGDNRNTGNKIATGLIGR